MEIPWPAWFLPYHPFELARSVKRWHRRRQLGLPPMRTAPVTFVPTVDKESFARSGYQPRSVAVLPYERQALDYRREDELLLLDDPSVELDGLGGVVWRETGGEARDHPVFTCQYALAALGGWAQTGNDDYLTRALINAQRLATMGETDESGAFWLPYRFPYRYFDVKMPVPWWSGMAQGQALSLFSRLAALTEDPEWSELAERTFRTFEAWRALGKPWITTMDASGMLWFEEYAGDVEPLLVVNGHVFALYGLYDYVMLTGNARAGELFDGGATTIAHYIDRFRVPGDVSYYCVRDGYCQRPEWQNAWYHPIHVQQLRMLGEMTGDELFRLAAEDLAGDVGGALSPS